VMKALLLIVALAYGQNCFNQPLNNCSFATSGLQCILIAGACLRSNMPCDTSSASVCPGTDCANGTFVTDGKSCSKCTDTCYQNYQDNSSCVNAGGCRWSPPICANFASAIAPACDWLNQSGCVSEPGCFWISVSDTQCGVRTLSSSCSQCNASYGYAPIRSALYNNLGNTCSWSVLANFTAVFSLTVNAYSQASTLCSAFTAPDPIADGAALTTAAYSQLFSFLVPFQNGSTISCVPTNPTPPPSAAPQTQAPAAAPQTTAPSAAPTKAPQAGPTVQVASANSLAPRLAALLVFFVAH